MSELYDLHLLHSYTWLIDMYPLPPTDYPEVYDLNTFMLLCSGALPGDFM